MNEEMGSNLSTNKKHRTITVVVVIVVALFGLLAWFSIGQEGGAEQFPISWFIIVVAIIGSMVNEPFRKEEPGVSIGHGLLSYSLWKAAVAVVFAFLLYLLFISGLLSGDVFPKFSNTEASNGGQYESMKSFLTAVEPQTNKDVAKILVWCFIAGYSEKFVPNLIERVIRAESRDKQRK